MVCKEDVLLWFKDLESFNRIDLMYDLLNMCVPFEIRFLGNCIEEIGKHSYQELRGSAIIANDIDKLTKDVSLLQGLTDNGVRHRVLIYLSLLSGRNCKCANWFYKTLLRTEWVESYIMKGNYQDENLQNELLLLFTMGAHHPAFTFEQRSFFGNTLRIFEQRKYQKHMMAKPFPPHPPGFGCSNAHKIIAHPVIVPMKNEIINHGDPGPRQPHPQNTYVHPATYPADIVHMLNRSSFAGPTCGAPEMAPFPPLPVSPIVSQPTSPSPSRTTSPHSPLPFRSIPGLQPSNPLVEVMPLAIPLDPLAQPSLPIYNSDIKTNDDDITHIPEDKLRDAPWLNSVMVHVDMKPPNGIRFASYNKVPQQYFINQMQALNLEGENSLHYSSSSSSSDNSLNQSPPGTPTVTPAVPYHGPGRGNVKARTNGVPQQFVNTISPNVNNSAPMCDMIPTPSPLPTLSNCSVPYCNYPPQVTLATIPNRSVFHYTQSYRPPFSTQLNYQHPEMYSYSCPYMPFVFSSAPPQIPPQNSNCFNCGATDHLGTDCNGQTIEEITQKKAYTLEYNSPIPDTDK